MTVSHCGVEGTRAPVRVQGRAIQSAGLVRFSAQTGMAQAWGVAVKLSWYNDFPSHIYSIYHLLELYSLGEPAHKTQRRIPEIPAGSGSQYARHGYWT